MPEEELQPLALARLPLGAIRASGWLEEQLRRSASGLTGRLMDVWPDVGPESGWLGGDGERWERGPYYVRGLVSLAHVLGDAELTERARPWIEWTLASQRDDGFFGPHDNDDWWARMPMLEALCLHHEATSDGRVLPFLTRYFRHQLAALPARPLAEWAPPRGGDNIDHALWLHARTREAWLLDLMDLLHRQTSDWTSELSADAPSEAFEFAHGVNRAMGLKEPLLHWRRSGDARHRAAFGLGWRQTMAHSGQIHGLYSCDEMLHGTGPTQGTELCTVVELISTLGTALAVTGEPWIGDALERLAYNALPAMVTPDLCGHQYFGLANQVACTPGPHHFWYHHGTNLLFGVAPGYGCCAANMHIGWPYLVRHLWMTTPDGGLAAALLAPSRVTTRIGDTQVSIASDTTYPFGDDVRLVVDVPAPTRFPLAIRVPAWASHARVEVNDEPVWQGAGERFVREERTWRSGDVLHLALSAEIRASRWHAGGVGVERGALVYALTIGEDWRPVGGTRPFADFEVHPTTPWAYGLAIDPEHPARGVRQGEKPMGRQPWARDGAPIRLIAPGRRIVGWDLQNGSAGPLPTGEIAAEGGRVDLELIPFGCARLRMSVLPVLRPG